MDLVDVQARIHDVNPYYSDMLTWEQRGRLVKAIPKKALTNLAFQSILKVFRKLGGRPVYWGGRFWFELVLEECGSKHLIGCCTLKGTIASESSPATLGTVLTQIEAQVTQKEASS